eukprot:TRINITY_DN1226_c0_g3_i1.p2 TRINITY_DN1226_c0_g3~~TRINITY_DN1226_c0_g3_i1.p2  ORF type:complete len:193 (-),score=80.10 TRINITY_DN1226_c0_g3_i1:148-726(-)
MKYNQFGSTLRLSDFTLKMKECNALLNRDEDDLESSEEESDEEEKKNKKKEKKENKDGTSSDDAKEKKSSSDESEEECEKKTKKMQEKEKEKGEEEEAKEPPRKKCKVHNKNKPLPQDLDATRVATIFKGTPFEHIDLPLEQVLPQMQKLTAWVRDARRLITAVHAAVPQVRIVRRNVTTPLRLLCSRITNR